MNEKREPFVSALPFPPLRQRTLEQALTDAQAVIDAQKRCKEQRELRRSHSPLRAEHIAVAQRNMQRMIGECSDD